MQPSAEVANITRRDGVVGDYSYTVEVTYPGQPTNVVQFTTGTFGNTYSVLMTTKDKTAYVPEAWWYGKVGPGRMPRTAQARARIN